MPSRLACGWGLIPLVYKPLPQALLLAGPTYNRDKRGRRSSAKCRNAGPQSVRADSPSHGLVRGPVRALVFKWFGVTNSGMKRDGGDLLRIRLLSSRVREAG